MHIDGIGYNPEWVSTHTEEEFIKEHKHLYEGQKGGTEKLKEAYALIKKAERAKGEGETEETPAVVDTVNAPADIPVKMETGAIPPEAEIEPTNNKSVKTKK